MAIHFIDGQYYQSLSPKSLFYPGLELYKNKIIECKNCGRKEPYPSGSSAIAWCAIGHIVNLHKKRVYLKEEKNFRTVYNMLPGDACNYWEKQGGHNKYSIIYESDPTKQ